jgi:hypothetical protein
MVIYWLYNGYIMMVNTMAGWWFGTWLLFFHDIRDVILPIDFHIFQRG